MDATRKLAALGCAVIVALMLMGCSARTIAIRGTVITYERVRLDGINLTYFVTNKNSDEYLRRGTAQIRDDGNFLIRIRHPEHSPYWVVIDGVETIPEASIMNNAYEVTNKRELEMNIGEVYIYDYIRILGDFSSPVELRYLKVQWLSDIPKIDFYEVELVGAISVTGIKGDNFSFGKIVSLPEKQGRYRIGEIEIIKSHERTEGAFFLDVKALRLIRGKAVAVGGAAQRLVTIVQE